MSAPSPPIQPAVHSMLSGLVSAAIDMSDDELMIVLGCILAVLGKRMGAVKVRSATEAALKAMEGLRL